MKKKLLVIIITVLQILPVIAFTQNIVKGVVYEDLNKNNLKEPNEKGIPGVCVSNGVDVVVTDATGKYELSVSQDNIVFVIKPPDYSLPVNEFNQPLFYYIHKPEGSPDLEYSGIPPTGELPGSVNFPLIHAVQKDSFRLLVFGDPQPKTLEEMDFFRRGIVSELKGVQGVDFGLTLGDLVDNDLDLHPSYIEVVSDIGIPWYNVIGNHDLNFDVQSDSLSDETFEKNFGPANYSFNYGMVHFIILDDILYPDPRDGGGYWGGFRKDQLEFIKNDLHFIPKNHLIILAFHIPLSEEAGSDAFRDDDRLKLFQLLSDYPYTLTLSAHTHYQSQDFFDADDGWLQENKHHHYNVGTTCGDWYSGRPDENGVPLATMRDGTPKGYAFININNNQYTIDYKVAGKSDDYYFEIFAPKVVEQNKRTTAGICANFFMGGALDTLYYRIDDGAWQLMFHIENYDPTYMHLIHEWDFTEELLEGSRPSNPVFSNHLWFGFIPTNLETGEHIIEIKAIDMFGRILTQKSHYRIAARSGD